MSIKILTLGAVLMLNSACATSGIVFDPTNFVENVSTAAHTLESYYKEVDMVKNQLDYINNQRIMLQSTSFHHLSDYTEAATSIGNVASSGTAITYSTKNLNDKFQKTFGSDDGSKQNYADRMHTMLGTVLDTSKGTLNAANQQMDAIQSETDGLNQIVNHSDSADGTKAVLQGTNQLLDANVAQLQSIKQSMAQMQSQNATADAAKAAQEEAAIKADQSFFNYKADYDGYKVDSRLQKVPTFQG